MNEGDAAQGARSHGDTEGGSLRVRSPAAVRGRIAGFTVVLRGEPRTGC